MKKILLTITIAFVSLLTMAQSPNLMNYQGVARNAVGNVLPNQSISLRLSILNGSSSGPVVYSETRTLLTNAFGLFNVVVGGPGFTSQTGTIAGINWTAFGAGSGNKYLQVEIDPNGGSSFTNVGSTQMVSVPYALNAGAAAPVGPAGGDLTGTYPNPQIFFPLIKSFNSATFATPNANRELIGMTNTAPTGTNGAIIGSSASNDASANAVQGIMTSTTPGGFSAALRGTNNGTGGLGIGVVGTQAGSGWGVYGNTPNGIGVYGTSTTGFGVEGQATGTGIGVYGISNNNTAGWFQNTTSTNSADILAVTTNGTGNGFSSVTTGTGRAGFFQVNNGSSTASALEAQTNGIGASWGIRSTSTGTNGAGLFVQSNPANTSNNVFSNQTGLGRAGLFQNTNTANTADVITAITVTTDPTPAAVHGNNTVGGTGNGITVGVNKGGWFEANGGVGAFGTSGTGAGVFGVSNTAGAGIAGFSFGGRAGDFQLNAGNGSTAVNVTTAGTGITGNFSSTNAANVSNTLVATNENGNSAATSPLTGGGSAVFARKGGALTTWIINPTTGYFTGADPAGLSSIGVLGITNNGLSVVGYTLNNGVGVLGQSVANGGIGVYAFNNSATGYGLATLGRVIIQGQGAGLNKILASDAVGNATWQTAAAIGVVTGSGTLNYIPKWIPNGTNLGNSNIFVDPTNFSASVNSTTMPVGNALNVAGAQQIDVGGAFAPFLFLNGIGSSNNAGMIFGNSPGVPDNGRFLYRTAGDYLSISHRNAGAGTNGLADLVVKNGFIGVNTITPGARMEIKDNSVIGSPQLLLNENDNDYARLSFTNNQGGSYWTMAGYNNATNTNERFNIYNSTTGNLMVIGGGGTVAVGTNTVNTLFKMHVHNSTGSFAGTRYSNTGTGENVDGFYVGQDALTTTGQVDLLNWENTDMAFFTNGITRMTIKNTGELDFYNALRPNGNAGTLNQIMASNGPGVAPDWKNVTTLLSPFVWSTLGNLGTVDGTHFIGTTDNVPFNVRVNNQRSGRIDHLNGNTSWGYQSFINQGGSNNTGIGQQALFSNSSGNQNTVVGSLANNFMTSGSSNVAVGYGALNVNGTGNNNAIVGSQAAQNTTGGQNSALGQGAMFLNTSGSGNTAIGYLSLFGVTTGTNNTGLGANTLVGSGVLTNATAVGANTVVNTSNSLILGNGANVGIGTSSPADKFDVLNVTGNQITGVFNNTNAATNVNTVQVLNANPTFTGTFGDAALYTQRGTTLGTMSMWSQSTGVLGANRTGVGVEGTSESQYGVAGFSTTGTGVSGVVTGASGVGVSAQAFQPTAYALQTSGKVQIQGQGAANGNVLTSDATGNATWQPSVSASLGLTSHFLVGNLTIPTATFTTITNWNNIVEDGGPNLVAGIYNITRAGTYQINAGLRFDPLSNNASLILIAIDVNGSTQYQNGSAAVAGDQYATSVSQAVKLAVGDKVKIQIYQNTGVNQSISSGYFSNAFSIQYLHN